MMQLADTDTPTSQQQPSADAVSPYNEDQLAARCMFAKDFDLLDIDHGHFWHKLSWHGVHVEFPSRLHHYEPNLYERQIRDYFVALPVDVLEAAFDRLQDAPAYTACHGDHCFVLEWDDEVQRHLHAYYERSPEGHEKDRRARDAHVQRHSDQYETNRQFPSKRLNAELEQLKVQRAKAQQAVEAWDRLIMQCQERIAHDEILHLGHSNSNGNTHMSVAP
jgi:hypothetical protein